MNYNDNYFNFLYTKATQYWCMDEPIPLDLYAEMMDYGLNVRELEDNYYYQLDS